MERPDQDWVVMIPYFQCSLPVSVKCLSFFEINSDNPGKQIGVETVFTKLQQFQ